MEKKQMGRVECGDWHLVYLWTGVEGNEGQRKRQKNDIFHFHYLWQAFGAACWGVFCCLAYPENKGIWAMICVGLWVKIKVIFSDTLHMSSFSSFFGLLCVVTCLGTFSYLHFLWSCFSFLRSCRKRQHASQSSTSTVEHFTFMGTYWRHIKKQEWLKVLLTTSNHQHEESLSQKTQR